MVFNIAKKSTRQRVEHMSISVVMNANKLEELINESIKLELNASNLYELFSNLLPNDTEFWKQLSCEETGHAQQIQAIKNSFIQNGSFPPELMADAIEVLKLDNARIHALIEHTRANPPTPIMACEIALKLEQDSGESYYTQFTEKTPESEIEATFRKINKANMKHEQRIREHVKMLLRSDPLLSTQD